MVPFGLATPVGRDESVPCRLDTDSRTERAYTFCPKGEILSTTRRRSASIFLIDNIHKGGGKRRTQIFFYDVYLFYYIEEYFFSLGLCESLSLDGVL